MNNGKPQNSILVLATLGVYLGLVLAGATPQILAQAATAKQFSVKDEIEAKGKVDLDPDPSVDELIATYHTYFRNVEKFVDDLAKLYLIEKFDPNWSTFDSQMVGFTSCPKTGMGLSDLKATHIDRWLVPAIEEAQFGTDDWTSLADCRPFKREVQPNWTKAQSAGIHLIYNKNELVYKISIDKNTVKRADVLYETLSRALAVFEVDEENALRKVLFAHTSLTHASDQVFVITRLPRSDLDALLATDAK